MPERANVFVGVDSVPWQNYYKRIIEAAGHQVILSAASKAEALRVIPSFPQLSVHVAVLDILDRDLSGKATQAVAHAIREHAPEVKIVKMSGIPISHTDIDFEIIDPASLSQLGQILTDL